MLDKYLTAGILVAEIQSLNADEKELVATLMKNGFSGEFEVQAQDHAEYPGIYTQDGFKKLINVSIDDTQFKSGRKRADIVASTFKRGFRL